MQDVFGTFINLQRRFVLFLRVLGVLGGIVALSTFACVGLFAFIPPVAAFLALVGLSFEFVLLFDEVIHHKGKIEC